MSPDRETPPVTPPRIPSTWGGVVYLVLAVCVLIGLLAVALWSWRSGVVVIGAGPCGLMAGLVLALIVGKRLGFGTSVMRPHNVPLVMIGAGLLAALLLLALPLALIFARVIAGGFDALRAATARWMTSRIVRCRGVRPLRREDSEPVARAVPPEPRCVRPVPLAAMSVLVFRRWAPPDRRVRCVLGRGDALAPRRGRLVLSERLR